LTRVKEVQSSKTALSNSKTESEKGSQGGTDAEEGMPETLYVHVCGAVNAPGVYELRTDARIYEALEAAGGMTEDAAADWINQAEALSDGERIYVPTQEEAEESAQSVSGQWADPNGNAGGSVSDKININTAAKEELMTLSGSIWKVTEISEAKKLPSFAMKRILSSPIRHSPCFVNSWLGLWKPGRNLL